MGKTTIVRQNRCDSEMNFLLFGCFFFFMAMQLFAGGNGSGLANGINMSLFLVFVPGFIFRLGYCFRRDAAARSEERGKSGLLLLALRYYLYFLVLAMGQEVIQYGNSIHYSFARILSAITIPSVSAVFFTMALLLLVARAFYGSLIRLSSGKKQMLLLGAVCILCAFLRIRGESYEIMAALIGSAASPAVAGIPYFAYFLMGMWFEEKKPGFQWKTALIMAAGTAVSLALYRTPLADLCRVAISLLPVYLVYVAAEGLSDLTVRFSPVRFLCESVEPVFWAYSVLLFAVSFLRKGSAAMGSSRALLLGGLILLAIYGMILCFVLIRYLYGMAASFLLKVKHKTAAYFIIYTLVFGTLAALVFAAFLITGRTLIWEADGVSQYYPRAVYYARYIRELIQGFLKGNFELPMYDFRLGMGGEITYSLEPLYFLFALFGEDKVEFTYNLVTLLRFYLTGVTSSILFLYFKKDHISTFIASVVYTFCGFALFGGARHTMFMIAMIMLPLLIIAVEEILKGKRWYLCTIFVAVSLLGNFYYLYMSTLGLAVYFLVRFFCQKEKEKRTVRNFLSRGLVISGSYLLGVAMSCISLATLFGLYVGSARNGAAVIKTPSLFYYSEQWPVRCFLTFLTTANSPGEWMKLGFLPIAYLAIVFLFTRKGRKELKVLSLITGFLMLLPVTGFVTSGFSSVINRWCYMISLLVAFIVADCLDDMRRMERREIVICGISVAVYGFLAFFGICLVTKYTKLAFVCLLITFGVLLLCQERISRITRFAKQSLMLLLTFALVFYNGFSLFYMNEVYKEYTVPGEAQEKAENSPLVAVKEVEDESFYRVASPKLDYSTISSSAMLDYNGITTFSSALNGSILEYLEAMGSTSYSVTQLMGLNNRAFMNELASVKYYAYYENPGRTLPYGYEEVLHTQVNGRETIVCENKYALPLGYTYSSSITREELEQYDVLERQEVLMQNVLLESSESSGLVDPRITLEPIEVTKMQSDGVLVTENALVCEEAGGSVKLKFESLPNSETYLVLKNAVLEGDMSENPINIGFRTKGNKLSYKFRSEDDRYKSGQQDYVFNLGYHQDAVSSCKIIMDRAGVIRYDSLELYSQPMDQMETYTESLTEDVLENVEIGTNTVSGSISLGEDKTLVLSIPYQNGWTAYVDGKEVKLQRANYMYMALPLTAGDHTVELTFAIPGVKYALVIMVAAVVLFIVLCIVTWIRKRKRKQKNSQER